MSSDDEDSTSLNLGELDRYTRAITPLSEANMGESAMTLEDISFCNPRSRSTSGSKFDPISEDRHGDGKGPVRGGINWLKCTVVMTLVTGLLALGASVLYVKAFEMKGTTVISSSFSVESSTEVSRAIPHEYSGISSLSMEEGNVVPLLWDIPGDGDVYQRVLSKCLGLVAAGGALGDPRQTHKEVDEPLDIFEQKDGSRYVNVYTGTMEGLERANATGLLSSGLADVIYAPLLFELAPLFTDEHPAKMFALFHHPVHRISGIYHITRNIIPEFQNKTMLEFLDTSVGANNNNWLTRELAGGVNGPLDEEHFELAKEVIKQKCLVGVSSDLFGSLERVLLHFGWGTKSDIEGKIWECKEQLARDEGTLDRLYFDLVEEDSHEWDILVSRNEWDIRLHEYVNLLYKQQADELGA